MSKSLGLIDSGGRQTAWELIILNEITTLPVNPFVLAAKSNIQVLTYRQLAENTGNTVEFYETRYNKTAFSYRMNGNFYIAYKSCPHMDENKLRVTVMHEFCHIYLGHPLEGQDTAILHNRESERAELEANKLLRRVFAPSIVLHMCGCESAEEIAALCKIPLELAAQRFDHLQDLRYRNAFFIHEYERDLHHNFTDFICSYLVEKCKQKRPGA